MRSREICARLDACAWRVDRDERIPGGELRALADAVVTAAGGLDAESREQVQIRVQRVNEALAGACRRIETRLGSARGGRRAVRGYTRAGARN